MSEKGSPVQAEHVTQKPRRKGCIGNCIKFWWAYLIGTIAVILLVVLLIIFVAVPKIAQSKLDEAELTIEGIVISNTQSKSLQMAINSTIRSDGKIHAVIDGFVGQMYLEDKLPHVPFASINFPQTTSDALQTVNVSQALDITDMAALTTFNTWLLTNETVRITVVGETFVHVKGLAKAYSVTFKKTIETPGLRGFEGTTVKDAVVTLAADKDGNNFKAVTNIPNYSVFTLDIGNATFYNYLLGEEIGNVTINNIVLYPGLTNEFPMAASVAQAPVIHALGEKPYCDTEKGVLPLAIRGKTVLNNGQPLSYFADALASHNQTIPIDVGTPVAKLLGGPVPCSKS